MPQSPTVNRRIVMAARPNGAPTPQDFRLETQPVPVPKEGEVLLRTVWLSLDPYMRGRMSEGPSYFPPLQIGETMNGGTVSIVEASRHPDYATGEWVVGYAGWQDYATSNGTGLYKLSGPALKHPSWGVGLLGMPGFTGYEGLIDIGNPQAGETVVVAAASGAVGSVVGQVAKHKGCRVVGIAGGPEKCRYVVDTLGFDACLDHRAGDLPAALSQACPKGIDVYFENVGGKVFDAVLPLMNPKGRIPVCGLIADYNTSQLPEGTNYLPLLQSTILRKRLRVQGFIIMMDYPDRRDAFIEQMSAWVDAGKIVFREDIVEGFEKAPEAFMGLLQGKNFGKVVVRVADDHPVVD
jgi:NADPH-dependent curcumin reductase CurA